MDKDENNNCDCSAIYVGLRTKISPKYIVFLIDWWIGGSNAQALTDSRFRDRQFVTKKMHHTRPLKLHRQFLSLIDKFFDPLLNPCLLPFNIDLCLWLASVLAFKSQPVVVPSPPSIPLADLSATLGELLGTPSVLLRSIFFIKLSRIFSKFLSDLLNLILTKQRRRTRPPKELLETIPWFVQKLLTFEIPNRKARLRL